MCCAFFMCRETTSGSNKAGYPPLRKSLRPCAPVTLHARRNASISASLLTSPVVPTNKKAHQDDVLFLLYGTIYGREPNRTVGVRRLLANACVMHRV